MKMEKAVTKLSTNGLSVARPADVISTCHAVIALVVSLVAVNAILVARTDASSADMVTRALVLLMNLPLLAFSRTKNSESSRQHLVLTVTAVDAICPDNATLKALAGALTSWESRSQGRKALRKECAKTTTCSTDGPCQANAHAITIQLKRTALAAVEMVVNAPRKLV